jgi:hypothetical protein
LDHYLDDFIFSGIENSDQCKALMNYFLSISQELGIPITDEKIPVTVAPQPIAADPALSVKSSITIERFQKVQPHMHIRFRFCIQPGLNQIY